MKKLFKGKKQWGVITLLAVLWLGTMALLGLGIGKGVDALVKAKANKVSSFADGTLQSEMELQAPRDDYAEVKPSELIEDGNVANQMLSMKGGAFEQAEERRTTILNAEDEVKAKEGCKTYYISPKGDNFKNDGTSPETPFRSIQGLDVVKLEAGDAVLFERGSVFRLEKAINAVSGITYGAYGEGEKPCIYGSPNNYADASKWKPTNKKNVWKLATIVADVGTIVFDHGVEVGVKKMSGLNQLEKTGDFFHNEDNDFVYLYCEEGNPGKVYKDIEFNVNMDIFRLDNDVSDVTIDNLTLKYCGALAIDGAHNNKNITITNCEIGYIGGSKLSLSTRYGNAIQFWNTCDNVKVENCWIYQTYDTAFTFQGQSNGTNTNISFCNNLLEYNDMDVEFWSGADVMTIENLKFDNNIMRFSSYGWGTRVEEGGTRGMSSFFRVYLDNKEVKMSGELSIQNNIFDGSKYGAIKWMDHKDVFTISGNTIYTFDNLITNRAFIKYKDKEYFVTDQATLEAAFKTFDSTATIKWLTEY